jgi:hypothetical protein
MHRRRTTLLVLTAALAVACGGGADAPAASSAGNGTQAEPVTVVVHKTPTCTCCGSYEEHLEAHGFAVEVDVHDDIAAVKDRFGVPKEEWSCHTNEVAGYAVEGHVPMEAIELLLDERPDVDGITLAGMPSGSPGMPGEQTEPFVVRTILDGEVVGELGRF